MVIMCGSSVRSAISFPVYAFYVAHFNYAGEDKWSLPRLIKMRNSVRYGAAIQLNLIVAKPRLRANMCMYIAEFKGRIHKKKILLQSPAIISISLTD